MFRVQNGILSDRSDPALDADVIMTCVVLGFSAGRLAVGHPVKMDMEISPASLSKIDDEKLQELADDTKAFCTAIDKVNNALTLAGMNFGGKVEMGTTEDWRQGAMITGAAGASHTPFAQRHANISSSTARELHDIAASDTNIGYQGRGAYTGFVDDPVGNGGSIKSTMRYNVPANGHGDRWVPRDYMHAETGMPWGMIGGLKAKPLKKIPTMVAEHPTPGGLVGYTHGMIQAIYDCGAHGPWCTPFEIAVGSSTTKLASCFTCSLFMYAAGYPPSSIHLGRGESWTPFYPKRAGNSGYSSILDSCIESINIRWQLECMQHLKLGIKILDTSGALNGTHAASLTSLKTFISEHANDLYCGGNLVLDAVTVHSSETTRLVRTLR
jgi:hypothetical protein